MSDIRSFEIDLDLKQNILVTLLCKQLDNLNIKFNIWNDGQVADINNYKCRLKALKSDYIPLIQNTDISISGNIVTVEADEQLTTTSGMVKTELQFIDKTTGKKKSSFNLNIKVVSGALEADRTISKATITLLEQLDNKLNQIEDIEAVVEEAKIVKDELVTKTNEANTIKNELEAATTNAENKKNEINTAVTNANNKIEEVNTSISNANASKEALDTSKKNADTLKESLDESIDIGNTLRTNLDAANSLATNNKTALDNSNQDATNTKNELEELNSNATNIKNELDNSNNLATTNKSELDKANNLAQTNKTALDEANALAEHNIEELNKLGDVTELAKQVETNKIDIASINNKIGTTELTTTDKSISGAIEEVKEIADKNTTQLKDLANPSILINGDFRKPINQRNFSRRSYTGSNWAYGIDRWVIGILDSTGQSECILNDGYISLKSKANDGCVNMYTLLENPQLYYGETLTASFKYRIVEGQPNCVCAIAYNNLIKNGVFFDYNKSENKLIADGQWHVYTFTYTVSGEKVNDNFTSFLVGTGMLQKNADDDDYTWVKPTVDTQIDIEWAKLEIGSKATPFVPRPYAEELALCKRYYELFNATCTIGDKIGNEANKHVISSVSYTVEKRVVPTVTYGEVNWVHVAIVPNTALSTAVDSNTRFLLPVFDTTGYEYNGVNLVTINGSADAEIY